MLQQRGIALPQWGIAAMPQRIAAIPVSMLVLPQYCRNADAACNALQHCRNTYCRNIEAHCRNAPFVASLRQCCYCKGHCGNALWHCRNTLVFSRCYYCTIQQSIASCFSVVVKYNDNDSYSSPVPPTTVPLLSTTVLGAPNNGTIALNNGTVAPINTTIEKKTGAVFCLILASLKPLFSVTHHPLHPFLAPKSTVLQQ